MIDTLLIINAGSSSVKFQLFGRSQGLPRLATGSVTGIGTAPVLAAENDETGAKIKINLPLDETQKQAVRRIIDWINSLHAGWKITAVVHRFVHGGSEFFEPTLITSDIFHRLKRLIPLAPLHQQHHLSAVGVIMRFMPMIPQIACFDTAFHNGREAKFINFALPQEITNKGVHRYGFHGLSYAWTAQVLKKEYPELASGRVVAAHLGNGASLCAMKNGRSVDTTMGMTVLDGLPMGTRCGAIDGGVIFYIIRELGMRLEDVERMLYMDSGLKGLSGISNDVKALLDSPDPRAKYALDYFALHIAKYIAAMAVSIGGIDALVFTGGIGEHAEPVRKAVLEHLAFLNLPRVLIIPANEERFMAEQALVCLANKNRR